MSGPLDGMKVLEIASIGPGPFAAMVLADLGADVLRIERPGPAAGSPAESLPMPEFDPLTRGRPAIQYDLKRSGASATLLSLVERADVLLEGFRPGVMERLGLGPEPCMGRNARLVYGRMTGWGQNGPLASAAGHDIGYVALAGALYPMGDPSTPPRPALDLVADFGGGGMLMCIGILSAIIEARSSGLGQVIDAAMVDGVALLTTAIHGANAAGRWGHERGTNMIDGSAHFYRCYETADGKFVSVGAIEPRFYAVLVKVLGFDLNTLPPQMERSRWTEMSEAFAKVFRTRTRDEWTASFANLDACFAPVLSPAEAPLHPHLRERVTFIEIGGVRQPAPAPRFSRTVPPQPSPPTWPGSVEARAALERWGVDRITIGMLTRPTVQ